MSDCAIVGAKVGRIGISVIAAFVARCGWVLNICSPKAIPAHSYHTLIGASIEVAVVPIVAGFSSSLYTVSTSCFGAVAVAAIPIYQIAVIAGLKTLLNTIATGGRFRVTAIFRAGCRIVFCSRVTKLAGIENAVAAARGGTVGSTCIRLGVRIQITVIAKLSKRDLSVATTGWLAVAIASVAI